MTEEAKPIIMNTDATRKRTDQVVTEEVKATGAHIPRGYTFPPRTSVLFFQKTRRILP